MSTATNEYPPRTRLPLNWDGVQEAKDHLAGGRYDTAQTVALVAIAEELQLIRKAMVAGNTAT
jgi:hypothetical protein